MRLQAHQHGLVPVHAIKARFHLRRHHAEQLLRHRRFVRVELGLELIHGGSQAFGVLLGDDGGHAEDLTRAHHHRGDVHAVVEPVDDGTEALLDVADEDGGARGIEPSGEYGTMRGHVGVVQRLFVVEQADPHGWQRADVTPRSPVGSPHLHVPLQPNLREARREVLLPVVQRGVLAGEVRQFPLHEIPERLARDVVINPVSVHKVHRHVEDVLRVSIKPEPILEDPLNATGPVRVGVRPHVAAQGLLPGWFTVAEG